LLQSKEKLLTATVETGEEEEHTYFSSKAKLFHFSDKVWKERGVGTFKVNVKESSDDSDSDIEAGNKKKSARMIMRADGVLRVMLNSPIFKGMPIGDVSGEEPKGKQLNLASVEDGKTVPLLLRVIFPLPLYSCSFTDIVTAWQRRISKGSIPCHNRLAERHVGRETQRNNRFGLAVSFCHPFF
jgi:RanBP1 domain